MWSARANVSAMSRPKPSEQVIVNSASALGAPALAFLGVIGGRTRTRTLVPLMKSQLLPATMMTSLAIRLHITSILLAL